MKFYYRDFDSDCLEYLEWYEKYFSYTMKSLFFRVYSGYSPILAGYQKRVDFNSCDVAFLYRRFFRVDFRYSFVSAYCVDGSDVWCYVNTDGVPVPEPYQGYLKSRFNYDDDSLIFKFSNYDNVPVSPLISERIATYRYDTAEFDGVVYHYLYLLHYKGVGGWYISGWDLHNICIPDYCVVSYDYLFKIKELL